MCPGELCNVVARKAVHLSVFMSDDFAWFSASQIFAVTAFPGGLTAAGPSV